MDYREDVITKVICSISQDLTDSELYKVKVALTVALGDYDLTKRCTEVALIDNDSNVLIRQFLATLKTEGRTDRTIKQYNYVIKKFHDEVCKPLKDVNSYDIRLWIAKRLETANEVTVNGYRACLSSFYNWVFSEEIISKNPMAKIKPIKEPKIIKKEFSEIDISKLKDACNNTRERAIVEFLYASGVRIEEFCNLKISDINPETREVTIRSGKGKKDRTTVINGVANMWLNKYLAERNNESVYLFTQARDTTKTINDSAIRKMLKNIGKRANVENVHPHRFRHTFATTMYRRGMQPSLIQVLMGHASISQTMEYISVRKTDAINEYKKVS